MGKPDAKQPKTVCRTQAEVAERLDCSTRTLRTYLERGCPGEKDAYILEDIQRWVLENIKQPGGNHAPRQEADEGLEPQAGSSPALERYRLARARMAERELAKSDKQLIESADVRVLNSRIAKIMRSCGEQLQRQCGEKAFLIFDDKLTEAEEEWEAFCNAIDEGSPTE